MPFCANCGTAAEGRFCPKCGAAMGVAEANPGGYTPPPPPPPPGSSYVPPPPPPGYSQPISAPGLAPNIASLLSYIIPIVCPIVFLVVEPYKSDRSVRFNAYQSLLLTAVFIVANIAIGILVGILWRMVFLYSILRLLELVVIVFCAFKAFQNEKLVLPVVGPFAEKQAWSGR